SNVKLLKSSPSAKREKIRTARVGATRQNIFCINGPPGRSKAKQSWRVKFGKNEKAPPSPRLRRDKAQALGSKLTSSRPLDSIVATINAVHRFLGFLLLAVVWAGLAFAQIARVAKSGQTPATADVDDDEEETVTPAPQPPPQLQQVQPQQ